MFWKMVDGWSGSNSLFLAGDLVSIVIGGTTGLRPFLNVIRIAFVNSLFPRTARLSNFLLGECYFLIYGLHDFN